MPCFIRQIRRQRIRVPDNVSLFNPEDAERIEEELKSRLSVETHEQLHQKMDELQAQGKQEELRKVLEDILGRLSQEKEQSGYPDRFKDLRKRWKEIWAVAPAQ